MSKGNDLLISFVIIGAQKCGTTSLAYQLSQHPEICFCDRKEPHFFSSNKDWQKSLPDYLRLFRPDKGQLCGEASTSYTFRPQFGHTAEGLHAYNSEMKLIYIIRHPIERMISQYTHDVLRQRTRNSFEVEVLSNPIYVNRSRYAMQLEPYLELFPRKNLLIMISEEYLYNPETTLSRIAQFLDISPTGFQGIDMTQKNAASEGGHIKIFPGWKTLRPLYYQLPAELQKFAKLASKPLGRIIHSTGAAKPEVSAQLRDSLWLQLEDDINSLKLLVERPIDVDRHRLILVDQKANASSSVR